MSGVNFHEKPTRPLSAIEPAGLVQLTNEGIQSGKLIVISPLEAGEYRISHIYQQLPDGRYDCLFRAHPNELKMCDSRNYPVPPFTK